MLVASREGVSLPKYGGKFYGRSKDGYKGMLVSNKGECCDGFTFRQKDSDMDEPFQNRLTD
jgi:hypothetical protein